MDFKHIHKSEINKTPKTESIDWSFILKFKKPRSSENPEDCSIPSLHMWIYSLGHSSDFYHLSISKRISTGVSLDSPFRNLPNFSTPPSRFAKIMNPFEPHLIERLHLPTFSPNVFAQNSTPKTEQKFKWTIEDISSLKPADIDETTVSQHIHHTDPHVESIVQQKIDNFFSEKVIVPSPMNVGVLQKIVPLVQDCSIIEDSPPKVSHSKLEPKLYSDGTCQTVLTLPPQLPKKLEEVLKPFFTYSEDQQQTEKQSFGKETSLYKRLFEFDHDDANSAQMEDRNHENDATSYMSSPAISTGFSPIQLSPFAKGMASPSEIPELKACNLSPIQKKSPVRLSRSACRLNFSSKICVDNSMMVVPDVDNQQEMSVICGNDGSLSPPRPTEISTNKTQNWSMEYHHVSLISSSDDSDKMDVSNSNTPHLKMFTSHRKRLSDSFHYEESNEEFATQNKENINPAEDVGLQGRNKIFRNDLTDLGYQTGTTTDDSNFSTYVFASTPSKRKN